MLKWKIYQAFCFVVHTFSLCSCSKAKASLHEVHVDFLANVHAVLELVLVIALRSLCLNVLLDCINLRLVLNEFLFDVVKSVVNIALQNLVLLGIMLHRVEGHLLLQTLLVYLQEVLDLLHAVLFFRELSSEVVRLRELVIHFVFHLFDLLLSLLHFFLDSSFQVLYFLQVALDGFALNLKSSSGGLAVL
jgi:hypothetical protein